IYIIPFYFIIGGEEKLAPFNFAYTPDYITIEFASLVLPLSAYKYQSNYNALGSYKVSEKLSKSIFIVMTITGFIGFFILYLLAQSIATITLDHESGAKGGWSVADITWIIRIISMVVIFIPLLATWRGVFQGDKSMGPTAVSEV